ncbi:MAG: crosslink repair DNA glycosylase YcaQ family protein [Ignavibacteriaceae bacterium]
MNRFNISREDASQVVLNAQLLINNNHKYSGGKKSTAGIINKLRYVQIDTISVINRAHHHILWNRNSKYSEKHLHDLQAKERLIFEYWTHAMSFIPMEDYRYSLPRMKNFRTPKSKWLKYRFDQSKKYFNYVLDRIKEEGQLSSSDFENDTGKKGGTWWQWKPTKTALEYLFWQGDLMISERKNFQKYYNLPERVLPGNIDLTIPSNRELSIYFIKNAVSSLGLATENEILKFMQPGKSTVSDLQLVDKSSMKNTINKLHESGEIISLFIENNHKIKNYALPVTMEEISKRNKLISQVHLLSPFDNLIIQRERTKRLFNFNYAIECYLPPSKRKYGYFVTPILWNNKFAGRFDPKADRQNETLIINNLVFEEGFKIQDEFLSLFSEKLKSFAEFNNCRKIVIKKCSSVSIKKIIAGQLKNN